MGDMLEGIEGTVLVGPGQWYRIDGSKPIGIKTPFEAHEKTVTRLDSNRNCSGITIGSYELRDFTNSNISSIIDIIAALNSPDLLFVQLYGSLDALEQLRTILSAYTVVQYDIASANWTWTFNLDFSKFGLYLYNREVLQLHNPSPSDNTTNEVLLSAEHRPELKYNPGLIVHDAAVAANFGRLEAEHMSSMAAWETVDGGDIFFTIDTATVRSDRPEEIVPDVGSFAQQILQVDSTARIIMHMGILVMNGSYMTAHEMLEDASGLRNLADLTNLPAVERYNHLDLAVGVQQDSLLVSPGIKSDDGWFEPVHVNTGLPKPWWDSQHDDPIVGKVHICR
jgi:hypothetical protein